jgi:hypothetical protein
VPRIRFAFSTRRYGFVCHANYSLWFFFDENVEFSQFSRVENKEESLFWSFAFKLCKENRLVLDPASSKSENETLSKLSCHFNPVLFRCIIAAEHRKCDKSNFCFDKTTFLTSQETFSIWLASGFHQNWRYAQMPDFGSRGNTRYTRR